MEKKCKKCGIIKPLTDYYKHITCTTDGHKGTCIQCEKSYHKEHGKNSISKKKYRKEYYWNNRDKAIEESKDYYQLNIIERREYAKFYRNNNIEHCLETSRSWSKNNRKRLSNSTKLKKERDPLFRLAINLRNRCHSFILGRTNSILSSKILRGDRETIKNHLEKQFKPGMNWHTYGKRGWTIDHIIPLSYATNEEELFELCEYTNLQPLWYYENTIKSNKIIMNAEEKTKL